MAKHLIIYIYLFYAISFDKSYQWKEKSTKKSKQNYSWEHCTVGMQCCRNYIAVLIDFFKLLSVMPQTPVRITITILSGDAVWKESCRVAYPGTAECGNLRQMVFGWCFWVLSFKKLLRKVILYIKLFYTYFIQTLFYVYFYTSV